MRVSIVVSAIIAGIVSVNTAVASVDYQEVSEWRGDTAVVRRYGSGDDVYSSCNVRTMQCAGQGTTTSVLYPELTGKTYVLSPDRTAAFVFAPEGATSTEGGYSVVTFGGKAGFERRPLSFNEDVKRVFFSNDNKRLLFTNFAGDLIVYDIERDAIVRRIASVTGSFMTFSPYGHYIAYYQPNNLSDRPNRVYGLIDVASGAVRTWSERNTYWDLLAEEERIFAFSPDERRFIYLSDASGIQTAYAVDLSKPLHRGRPGKRLFKGNFTVTNPLFGADGRLYVTANRRNPLTWSLYSYDFKDSVLRRHADDVSYWPAPIAIGKVIAFVSSAHTPPVVRILDLDKGTASDALSVPASNDAAMTLAHGTVRAYGGVYTVLYTPDGYDAKRRYPLIVWLHGGPHRQTSVSFHPYRSYGNYDELLERLRRSGFAVLKVDYRGSYGYGKRFAESIKYNVGKGDVIDVVTSVRSLKETMRLGPVYTVGNSYGGYLALRSLVGRPDVFSGAVSINGVTDWRTLIKNNPSSIFGVDFNGPPSAKNKALYDQASIFLRLKRVRDKDIIIVQGQQDGTVPTSQSDALFQELSARDDVAMRSISYAGEGHIIKDPKNLDDLYNAIMALISPS